MVVHLRGRGAGHLVRVVTPQSAPGAPALLLESGSFFLLEDGSSHLLLE